MIRDIIEVLKANEEVANIEKCQISKNIVDDMRELISHVAGEALRDNSALVEKSIIGDEIIKKDIETIRLSTNAEYVRNDRLFVTDNNGSVIINETESTKKTIKELSEEQIRALSEAGMSEDNIKKCYMDDNGRIQLKTINSGLEGKKHPDTYVDYVRKSIELNGLNIEGVFPSFEPVFECDLPEEIFRANDDEQFMVCMKMLRNAIENNPDVAACFSERQREQICDCFTPRIQGYIWHHSEVPGRMQLVKDTIHQKSSHTGGRSIWGGGR